MLRVGMTNPPFVREHVAEVVEFLQHPNVARYLHVPVCGIGVTDEGVEGNVGECVDNGYSGKDGWDLVAC